MSDPMKPYELYRSTHNTHVAPPPPPSPCACARGATCRSVLPPVARLRRNSGSVPHWINPLGCGHPVAAAPIHAIAHEIGATSPFRDTRAHLKTKPTS
eukprot:968517-Prymnesium_polylepis.1